MAAESPKNAAAKNVVTLILIVVLASCVLICAGLIFWMLRSSDVVADVPALQKKTRSPQAEIRQVSQEGYVGSQRCVDCHAEIHEHYQTHPMSRSLAVAGQETKLEQESERQFSTSSVRRFEVLGAGEGLRHAEVLSDDQGEIIRQEEKIDFVLGSGQRGRSYLVNHEGILFQSPIGWYGATGKYDLSPGYGRINLHFSRRVDEGCLYCHSGRVSTPELGSGRFDRHVFSEPAIGCERCHGPGRDHVDFHTTAGSPDGISAPPKDTIVNPANLDFAARNAVCYQCHLQADSMVLRRGRSAYDFRPGDRIEDVWVAIVRESTIEEARAVGQVQQMRVSQCFVKSDGQMGCVSCHDPHSKPPAAQRVEFFNARCLNCHETADRCAAPAEQRTAEPAGGSCIHCHMPARQGDLVPHTAHTDHRVLRDPQNPPPSFQTGEVYQFFDDADERLPKHVVERAEGLAMMERLDIANDPDRLRAAEFMLVPPFARGENSVSPLPAIGDDVRVLNALARNQLMQKRKNSALECLEEALKYDPQSESALDALSQHFVATSEHETTLRLLNQLIQANPYLSDPYGRRAHVLGRMGQLRPAVESARMTVRLDPNNFQVREWLVKGLKLAEFEKESAEQQRILDRMRAAMELEFKELQQQ